MTVQPLTPEPFATILLGEDIDAMPQPVNAPYFVVARQGAYVYKKMHFGWVIVPVKEIPTLPKMDGRAILWLDVPEFPLALLGQAWSFFRWAWDTRKSEAMLDITYSEKHGYRFFIPPQTASAGGVKCIRNAEHYKDALIGTIHSHCNGGAYHSGTDTHDADEHDGLHITMGRVSANSPELDFMVSANHERWEKIKMTEVTGKGRTRFKMVAHPPWWEAFHEHPAAVEKFKHTTFAAGGKPGAKNNPHYPFGNGRPYQGDYGYGGYTPGAWRPGQGAPKTAFADHRLEDFDVLMRNMEDAKLVEFLSPMAFAYGMDAVIDDLKRCVEDAEAFGIRVDVKGFADRQLLNAARAEEAKDAATNSANTRFWLDDEGGPF